MLYVELLLVQCAAYIIDYFNVIYVAFESATWASSPCSLIVTMLLLSFLGILDALKVRAFTQASYRK